MKRGITRPVKFLEYNLAASANGRKNLIGVAILNDNNISIMSSRPMRPRRKFVGKREVAEFFINSRRRVVSSITLSQNKAIVLRDILNELLPPEKYIVDEQ